MINQEGDFDLTGVAEPNQPSGPGAIEPTGNGEQEHAADLSLGLRRAYLEGLPYRKLPESSRRETIEVILASGLPVRNYLGFDYEHVRAPLLGGTQAWIDRPRYELSPAGVVQTNGLRINTVGYRVGNHVHEGLHVNSIFFTDNAANFGGEDEQALAQEQVKHIAEQCRTTGIYLNDYHKALANAMKRGNYSPSRFLEETWAIAGQMGLTQRDKLRQIQTEQYRNLAAHDPHLAQHALVSAPDSPIAQGIDVCLTNGLIDGVRSPADLERHAANFKQKIGELVERGDILQAPLVQYAAKVALRTAAKLVLGARF